MIKIKRVYEDETRGDGYRVLVDRLWPRGIKKTDLQYNEWPKEISPSTETRKFFHHDPERFKEFRQRYLKELRSPECRQKIRELAGLAKKRNVTLLYGARDEQHNHALILKELIEKELAHH